MAKPISEKIRAAARRDGLSIENFRRARSLPNTGFYLLLRGVLPSRVVKREEWRARLEAAGVRVGKAI